MATGFLDSWSQVCFIKGTSTWNTVLGPVAADAVQVLPDGVTLEGDSQHTWRNDTKQSRSKMTYIPGRLEGRFSVRANLIPSGVASTKPDIAPLLELVFPDASTISATEYQIDLKDRAPVGATIWKMNSDGTLLYQEGVVGAVGERAEFRFGNGGFAEVEVSGPAKRSVHAFETYLLQTTLYHAATSCYDFKVVDGFRFTKHAFIQVARGAASTVFPTAAGGFEVTTVYGEASTAHVVVNAPGVKANLYPSTCRLQPYIPTPTTAGVPIDSSAGSVTIGVGTYVLLGGTITVAENRGVINDEYGQGAASAVDNSKEREVTFDLEAYVKDEELLELMGRSIRGSGLLTTAPSGSLPIVVTIGNVALSRCVITMPYCVFNRPVVTMPENAPCRIRLTGTAKATSSVKEIKVEFT